MHDNSRGPEWRGIVACLAGATIAGCLAAVAIGLSGPYPSCETRYGSDDAFVVSGMHEREMPPRGAALRWTTERARLRFMALPAGPMRIEIGLHGQHSPVAVSVNGVLLGHVAVGEDFKDFVVSFAAGPSVNLELMVDPFLAGDGRRLGVLIDRVTVVFERRPVPSWRLAWPFIAVAWAWATGALILRLSTIPAMVMALLAVVALTLACWPSGLGYSSSLSTMCLILCLGGAVVAAFARVGSTRSRPEKLWLLSAILLVFWVGGVLTTSPLLVSSDVVMHAHKLKEVAAGNWFPTSVTQ
ncbi:MAG: hypothetical protein MUF51_07835, partial [Vicinamibacteria bacterium]|nr:hypothetical protein [Vicinamibacteria bacterium]